LETNGPAPTTGGTPTAGTAAWYQFTRNITDGVDVGTGLILGALWIVVHDTQPTSVTAHQAVWGPGSGDALSPVVWRLTVNEVGQDTYDYALDARPHTSTSESDYKHIVVGHAFGMPSPYHRSGNFTIDNDAYASLDPMRASQDSGTVKVTYDLRSTPSTILAEVKHTADPAWFTALVTHEGQGAGDLKITAFADIESVKDGNLENIAEHSRWDSTGAGRADLQFSGGNVPQGQTVQGSECWSTTFQETYYTDSVNYKPTSGDPSACAFQTASY
jgi:hypothetical protein